LIDRKKFEDQGTNTMFFRMNIQYIDNTPVVVCFEKGKEFKMVIYIIEDDQLNLLDKIRGYHSAPFLTAVELPGKVLTMDVQGFVYSLPLCEEGEVKVTSLTYQEKSDLGGYNGVVSFERKNGQGEQSSRGDIGLKEFLEAEKIRLANIYNNRRSMVVDFSYRKD